MMHFNPKFRWGHNLSFFGLGPWAIYNPWYRQIGKYFYLSNTNLGHQNSSYRADASTPKMYKK